MEISATIRAVVPFEINDEPYFTIYFAHDSDPDNVLEGTLPVGSVYPHPHVNDRIRIHYLFEIPTRIERVTA